jgi:hypothetical protein
MKYKGNIQIDLHGRAWLRLPGQRCPVQLDPAQTALIDEIVSPLVVQHQRALFERGYVVRPWRRRYATLLPH